MNGMGNARLGTFAPIAAALAGLDEESNTPFIDRSKEFALPPRQQASPTPQAPQGVMANVGNFFLKNQKPLAMAADLANIIGGYSPRRGRGFEMQKRIGNYLAGQTANQQLNQPTPQAQAPGGKEEISIKMTRDNNQNGIPDVAEAGGMGRMNQIPMQELGYPGNFPGGAGNNAGTSAPGAGPAPFVNYIDIDPMGYVGWSQGYDKAADLAKQVASNRLTGEERDIQRAQAGAHQLSASAAMRKAATDEMLAPVQIENMRSEVRRRGVQNAKDEAEIDKWDFEQSPAYIALQGAIEQAKKTGDKDAERAALEKAAKIADAVPITDPILKKLFKTHGEIIRASGVANATTINAAISAAATKEAAAITGKSNERAALQAVLSSTTSAIRGFDKYITPSTDPNTLRIQQLQEGQGSIKLWTPQAQEELAVLKEMRDRAAAALGQKGGLGNRRRGTDVENSIQIRVNGKLMSATKISDTQAIGEDGKTYNITPSKKR